jgi:predicted esterase
MTDLTFVHRYTPGSDPESPVLLLLHGTGGGEDDLVPLGRSLLPGAGLLSPRGKVLENGMPRFFRRIAEGVFDLEDLRLRTVELAGFIQAARAHYGLGESKIVAVGYSNGANMAASLMLTDPRHLSAAVLIRAMVPFEPEILPDLGGVPILLSAGRRDPLVPAANTRRLVGILEAARAQVSIYWSPGGHELAADDVQAARLWLGKQSLEPAPRTVRRL